MLFCEAQPVWAQGLQKEWTITLGFYTKVGKAAATLRVATAGFYRVFVNGAFVYYGPVRCAHGHYRVDEVSLGEYLTAAENHIAVETVNYAVPSFGAICQDGFIQMELACDGKIVAATAAEPRGFAVYQLNQRVRNVQRFSVQRTFAEMYRLSPQTDAWRVGEESPDAVACVLERTADKTLLPRELPLYTFPTVTPNNTVSRGRVTVGDLPDEPLRDRALNNEEFPGYAMADMVSVFTDDIQRFITTPTAGETPYDGKTSLEAGEYATLSLPRECTGFTAMTLCCAQPTVLYMLFDEILVDGDVDPLRAACCNIMRLDLTAGEHSFMNIEPLGYQYMKLVCLSGAVTVGDFHLREYVHPYDKMVDLPSADEGEQAVFEAAWHTFRQNAADVFTDCPTRERAGWLCDSFFIGRAAQFFTGNTLMEKQFLENFILPAQFEALPDGMVPMCYPSDHLNGSFILNWALWYVAQLEDYRRRTGDTDLVARSKDLIYRMLAYLRTVENGDGLLHHLPGWAFVEWSEANNLVQDINYPTNMVYAYMLKAAGVLYDDAALLDKAASLKALILARSFNGEFFMDNDVYDENGVAVSTGETTETCQYHAFFFGIATPDSHPELWEKLTTDFGPQRQQTGAYPKVHPSNAFTGNLLRLDILLRYGLYDQCRREVLGYYTDMARITGTLWEHMSTEASCNHGFAAYAATLLYYAILRQKPPYEVLT